MVYDHHYIERCKVLGRQAAEKGNPEVGAIIVKENIIISESEEATVSKNDITCHAEMEALRLAIKKIGTNNLAGCILYSTHEPCIMCAYAIRFYRIEKVVYLNKVKYLGSVSSSMALLTTSEVPPHWGSAPVIVHVSNECAD